MVMQFKIIDITSLDSWKLVTIDLSFILCLRIRCCCCHRVDDVVVCVWRGEEMRAAVHPTTFLSG